MGTEFEYEYGGDAIKNSNSGSPHQLQAYYAFDCSVCYTSYFWPPGGVCFKWTHGVFWGQPCLGLCLYGQVAILFMTSWTRWSDPAQVDDHHVFNRSHLHLHLCLSLNHRLERMKINPNLCWNKDRHRQKDQWTMLPPNPSCGSEVTISFLSLIKKQTF